MYFGVILLNRYVLQYLNVYVVVLNAQFHLQRLRSPLVTGYDKQVIYERITLLLWTAVPEDSVV